MKARNVFLHLALGVNPAALRNLGCLRPQEPQAPCSQFVLMTSSFSINTETAMSSEHARAERFSVVGRETDVDELIEPRDDDPREAVQ